MVNGCIHNDTPLRDLISGNDLLQAMERCCQKMILDIKTVNN